jgi:hypothetical protein
MARTKLEAVMSDYHGYGLTENPFPSMPGARVTNWAGMEQIRQRLIDIAESPLVGQVGLSEFVVVHGSYGAGKTHALRYLSTLINNVDEPRFGSRAIYMPKIKAGAKLSFVELYMQIMGELGPQFLEAFAAEVARRVDDAADAAASQLERRVERELKEADPKHFENQVVAGLPEEDRAIVRLLLDIHSGRDGGVRYLLEGKPIVLGSEFTQPISTDYMAVRVLAGLFRAMTLRIADAPPVYRGVHLFIDEVDDLFDAKAAEQNELWGAVRELVNRLPYNFCLLLAFSAEAALLEAVIPNAVAERESRQRVELHALSIDEAKEFIAKQLAAFRPASYTAPTPYYPFTEDAIDRVLEQIVIMVPRKIFRALRLVLERAIRREGLRPGDVIEGAVAEQIIVDVGI